MERKFFKSGNGWALFVPKTILELLKINPQIDKIEMQVENEVLKIKKINKSWTIIDIWIVDHWCSEQMEHDYWLTSKMY